MTDKEIADIICRALIAIIAVIRKKYNIPEYKNISVSLTEKDT